MKKVLFATSILLALQGCHDKKDPKGGTKTNTTTTNNNTNTNNTNNTKPDDTNTTPPPPKDTREKLKVSLKDVGLDADSMDKSVDPCEDFYQYACGSWLKNTEIPADQSVWYRSFSVIEEQNQNLLKEILEKSQTTKDLTPTQQKLATFYGSCMDEAAAEKSGAKAIAPLAKVIKGVKDKKTLVKAVAEMHKYGIWVVFDLTAQQDAKDATLMIAGIDQNGLGMPDRDYYFPKEKPEAEAARQKIVDAYKAYVETILTLSGYKAADAKAAVDDIYKLETALAQASLTREQRRDPEKTYNRVERKGVTELAPDFTWDDYFKAINQPSIDKISVSSKEYIQALNKMMTDFTPKQWQAYLTFHAFGEYAGAMNKAFVDAQFTYIQKLTGQPEIEPRWKRCVNATDGTLGELIGQEYIKTKFSEESKKATTSMVLAIRDSFMDNIPTLTWMDKATQEKAKEKRDKMEFLIGYPDKWKAYDYKLDPKDFAANALTANAFELQRTLSKIGKPVDRGEWGMTPATVNAYYDPGLNQMVFPAGILQPPFYSPTAGVAVNMGAMGMVVGHELTHGFDDNGAQYDAYGNLSDWWAPETKKNFEGKTQCVVEQYNKYEPLPGLAINGALTTGENIADIGGLKFSFRAYQSLRKGDTKTYVADGFTEDQQFFLGFAQAWCASPREEYQRLRVATDEHSPAKFRVNGAVSSNPIFSEAFGCKANSKMKPATACTVW